MFINAINQIQNKIIMLVGDIDNQSLKSIYLSNKITGKRTYWEDVIRIYPDLVQKQGDELTKLVFNLDSDKLLLKERKLQIRGFQGVFSLSEDFSLENIISINPLILKIDDSFIQKSKGTIKQVNDEYIYIGTNRLIARKRTNNNYGTAHYPQYSEIKIDHEGKVNFNLPKINSDLKIVDRDIIDVLEVDNKNRSWPVNFDGVGNREFTVVNSVKHIMYKTNMNTFGIRFAASKRSYIKTVQLANNDIKLMFEETVRPIELWLSEISSNDVSDFQNIYIDFEVKNDEVTLHELVNKLQDMLANRIKFNFVIKYRTKDDAIINTVKLKKPLDKMSNGKLKLEIGLDRFNDAKFNLVSYKRDKVVQVGVLGSSQTRRIFTSSEYFNPDYKDYFFVPFTQHHSSIRSIVDEKPVKFIEKYYNGKDIVPLRPSLRRDMEKTFFSELKEANIDYLLIDLYSDVQMGVLEFEDGRVITYTMSQVDGDYIAEEVNQQVHISSMYNDPDYREKFNAALKIFREKLLNVIDEERIVIHAFDLNFEYMGNDGERHKYSKPASGIAQANRFAVELQADLMDTFPRAAVLDSREWKWIGDENMPSGNMPHHFQSGRYIKQLDEFAKIVAQRNKVIKDYGAK